MKDKNATIVSIRGPTTVSERLWTKKRLRKSEEQQATSQPSSVRIGPRGGEFWRFRGFTKRRRKFELRARWILGIKIRDGKLERGERLYRLLEAVEGEKREELFDENQ